MDQQRLKPVLVSAGLIFYGSDSSREILIAKRPDTSAIEGGKWEFPGGKLEFGETPEACLAREIKEELDLDIEVGKIFDVASHVYDSPGKRSHIVLLCYICEAASSKTKNVEVADAKWIKKADLDSYDFALADIPVVALLKSKWDEASLSSKVR